MKINAVGLAAAQERAMNLKWMPGAIALLPLAAVAQQTGTEAPKALGTIRVESGDEPVETETATRLPMTLRETPQSVTIVDAERIEDQQLVSLRDVLDVTPGIYSYAYDTERVVFTSRGFVLDNLLFDGVPAESNFSTGSIDETIDTALYERIEIVRGATGLMTGAGSPAASVNLVRKRADSRELEGRFDVSLGSWDDRRIEADVATPLSSDGSVRGRVVGVWQDRESYQDLYRNERKVFYGVVEADLGENTLLTVSYGDQFNQPTSNTWGSFPLYLGDGTSADWSRSVTTATDWAFWDRRTKTAIAEVRHDFTNGWTLRSSYTWRRFDEDLALFYVFGYPDPATGLGLEPYAYRSDSLITENHLDFYASGPFSLFGREHQLVAGYNGSRTRNRGFEHAHDVLPPTGNFFEWDGSYPEPAFAAEGDLLQKIDSRQNGFYVASRFSLADRVTAIAGVRFATWKSDHFYLYDSADVTFRHDHDAVIPYAGLVVDVSSNYSLFASFTEIFKPQNTRTETGAYLDPLEGSSIEFGVKGEHFDGRFTTALTLFETKQDNVAAPVLDPVSGAPVLLPDGTSASFPIDGTRTRGFELEASGRIGERWKLDLGWSRYDIEDGDGVAIRTFTPRTLIRTFATWSPRERLSLGAGANWQSNSFTPVSTPTGGADFRQGEVLNLNAMARFDITDSLSVQLNGRNLLDKKYFVLDEYGNSYYGAPSNYSASFSWSF
jgi:outer membrane receptor for ferric coprogen and ferric-rhodotorulic acid